MSSTTHLDTGCGWGMGGTTSACGPADPLPPHPSSTHIYLIEHVPSGRAATAAPDGTGEEGMEY